MQSKRLIFLKLIFLFMTLSIMISSLIMVDNAKRYAESEEGILDLSDYNMKQDGMLTLDGEWQFFLNRFLDPVGYRELDPADKPDVYITPPVLWNYYKVDGKSIPGFSYGTYRLVVTGAEPNVPLAIKILPESTAYDFYIDDVQLAGNGVVGKDAAHSAPGYRPQRVVFTPHSTEFVITIHLSNFVFARGGMWDAPTLGLDRQIIGLDQFVLYRDLFFEGCYCISCMMFLVLFVNRTKNRAWLYFAVLCGVTAIRISLYGAHLINLLTDNFRVITFFEYGTRLWYPLLIALVFHSEFGGKIPRMLFTGLSAVSLLFTAAFILLPIRIFTSYAVVLMGYDMIAGLSFLILTLWPGARFFTKNKNKIFYSYGILSIFFCMFYDIFFASTSYFEMTPVGFFVALLAFSFIMGINYSDALSDSEEALRVLELESQRKLSTELKLLQSQIRPHFLYNALSAIANVCEKDAVKAEQLILDLAYYMQSSFDFSSSEKLTTLETELEYIGKYVNIEKARFGEKVRYTEHIGAPLDTQLPRLILEPLVENAIRHGISKKKGGGEVILTVEQTSEGIAVSVYDDGIGMSEEKLAELFREESRTVGLKNIQDRLIRMGGAGLRIESADGVSTKVSFEIKGV